MMTVLMRLVWWKSILELDFFFQLQNLNTVIHNEIRQQLEGKWTQTLHTNSSYSQTTATQIQFWCLLHLGTSPTLYQQTSSMETALSTLHQLNLLNSTHYMQWSTMSCTHSSLDYYPVKVKKYTTVTSTYSRSLVNNINFS
jgi:hypothetical protein